MPDGPGGAILIARSMCDPESWVWQLPPGQFKVWIYLLNSARWQPSTENRYIGKGKTVPLRRGQCMISTRGAAQYCRVGHAVVRGALTAFRENGSITTQSIAHRHTMVTIQKYDTYQRVETYRNTVRNTVATQLQHSESNKSNGHRQLELRNQGNQGKNPEEENPPPLLGSAGPSRRKRRVDPFFVRWMKGFPIWYDTEYPKKRDRQAAERAWAAVYRRKKPKTEGELKQLYANVVNMTRIYVDEHREAEPDKIKHPATFLNANSFTEQEVQRHAG